MNNFVLTDEKCLQIKYKCTFITICMTKYANLTYIWLLNKSSSILIK